LRLLGQKDDFEREVRKLADATDEVAADSFLLLNGRPEEALAYLDKHKNRLTAIDVLAAQYRFREAFAMAEKGKGDPDADPYDFDLARANLHAKLGERKKAAEIYRKLAESTKDADPNGRAFTLVHEVYYAGLKDEAFEHAADLLAKKDAETSGILNSLLSTLFPQAGGGADPWWALLRKKYPKVDAKATLTRLRDLFDRRKNPKELADLCKELIQEAAALEASERANRFQLLAGACHGLARADLERMCAEKWAEAEGSDAAHLRLGDLAAAEKRWKEAAGHYRKAWEKDRGQALPLYLRGWALAQAGDAKEGQRWMDLAVLQPLGSEDTRYTLAQGLTDRLISEAAGREWERLDRLATPASSYADATARELALKALAEKAPARAAAYARRELLHSLVGDGGIYTYEGQLSLFLQERQYAARGLLAAGKLDDARKEIHAALAVHPGSIDLAIGLVPELTKAGHKKDADELYERVVAVHEGLCKQYPDSPWSRNNTAWLCVRCRRDLDAALAHAQKAVQLEPDNAAYLDTLAEVHFQKGDKAKALELIKKCVELDAEYTYFRAQKKRIEAGDPAADVPPEGVRYY
jgi:Tfp pilus assembly protein PilF